MKMSLVQMPTSQTENKCRTDRQCGLTRLMLQLEIGASWCLTSQVLSDPFFMQCYTHQSDEYQRHFAIECDTVHLGTSLC